MKIEHVGLWSADIEHLRIFYETYFGARANEQYHNERSRFRSYFLIFESGARFEIMQRPDISQCGNKRVNVEALGYAHIAFSVGSAHAVDELTERLVADGYSCLGGPRHTGDGYYESVVLDPEGNRIEITV